MTTKFKVQTWFNILKVIGHPKPEKMSMTVPGQAVTPQDIVRSMTTGVTPPQVFLGNSALSEWDKMDIFERTEHLKKLAEFNKQASETILFQAEKLKKRHETEKLIQEHEQRKAEEAKKRDEQNDAK